MAKTQEATQIDIHVGLRLRRQRKFAGLSQEEIGKAVGVSFQQIQKYEKGANRIGAGQLFILAKILGIDVSDFFDGIARRPERTVEEEQLKRVTGFARSQEGLRLNLAYLNTPDRRIRKCFLALLAAIG